MLNEARYFNNYILSTDVGAAKDIIGERFGQILPLDADVFRERIQNIIDGKIDINVYNENVNNEEIKWDVLVKRIKL